MKTNKSILFILDGYGEADSSAGNAIKLAKTPFLDKFREENPVSYLTTSGKNVGLPEGIMGNSEVGHLNIGAGRIVYQMISMIDKAIEDKSFFKNKELLDAITQANKFNSKIHIMGLLSDGGVHSSMNHLFGLLDFFKKEDFQRVFFHPFMDGRDTSPHDGEKFLEKYLEKSKQVNLGKIATISGRYYSMDRDNRWDRIEKTYNALVNGHGNFYNSANEAIKSSYKNEITDEFLIPSVILENEKPVAKIKENDIVIFFNFRADRARQITNSLVSPTFKKFKNKKIKNLRLISFNEYDANLSQFHKIAFKPNMMKNILGEVLEKNGLRQLRIAETEKYAHVTFFFNGSIESPFKNEDRILINSPKVASYDLQPEMSAFKVKDALMEKLTTDNYDMIICNFANCDMVGHTGIIPAAIKAVETVDKCMSELIPTAIENNYNVFVTADHGNADKMLYDNGSPFTAHSLNKVPFITYLQNINNYKQINGTLSDIAPTILKFMNVKIPKEMTGKILINN